MKLISKMYDHLHWANMRILDSLKTLEDQSHPAKQLFSHILLAEEVWFNRIKGLSSSAKGLWTELSLDECLKLSKTNHQNFKELLSVLTAANEEDTIIYKNSTGKEFRTTLADILTHVALHGQYHRGQINRLLRQEQHEPINVDYITYVR
ncbi:DinB family protein [Neobacillus dielmonensis]|uniref:DinB family protein n=1 Tax=Neobacillus dielmonensis TaxID=1347369 RepID=UPI0005A87498|nr:DinB family protein [Neobacillus dielmonensis]